MKMVRNSIALLFAVLFLSRMCAAGDSVLLFSYFKDDPAWQGTGFNPGDGVHLAWSQDGRNWIALNNDEPVFRTQNHTSIRDPHIMRGHMACFTWYGPGVCMVSWAWAMRHPPTLLIGARRF